MSRKKRSDGKNNSADVQPINTTGSIVTACAAGQRKSIGKRRLVASGINDRKGSEIGEHDNKTRKTSIDSYVATKDILNPIGREAEKAPAHSRTIMSTLKSIAVDTLPSWLAVGLMLGLIFGGCCSNVFALEAIVKTSPDCGTLLTFVQFLFVAFLGYCNHFDLRAGPARLFLKQNKVPIKRWLVNITLFFTINVLNNHAFSYNISVPIHIILRSGGSITTIAVGYLWGKRFSRTQVLSVCLLTVGVIVAAWSDQAAKAEAAASNPTIKAQEDERPHFSIGLLILFVAQVLSAIMGIYTEETYREYGPQWKENLFYSHFISLPLFLPFLPGMIRQFNKLAASEPLYLPWQNGMKEYGGIAHLPEDWRAGFGGGLMSVQIPSQIAYMVMNVLTQYACIRGVNLLAGSTSALTVTIVLNVRKLVSLLLSIWLFGNTLSHGTTVGAMIVFGSGGMYSLDRGKPRSRPRARTQGQEIKMHEQGVNGKVG